MPVEMNQRLGSYGNEEVEDGILKENVHVYEGCSKVPQEYYATPTSATLASS